MVWVKIWQNCTTPPNFLLVVGMIIHDPTKMGGINLFVQIYSHRKAYIYARTGTPTPFMNGVRKNLFDTLPQKMYTSGLARLTLSKIWPGEELMGPKLCCPKAFTASSIAFCSESYVEDRLQCISVEVVRLHPPRLLALNISPAQEHSLPFNFSKVEQKYIFRTGKP